MHPGCNHMPPACHHMHPGSNRVRQGGTDTPQLHAQRSGLKHARLQPGPTGLEPPPPRLPTRRELCPVSQVSCRAQLESDNAGLPCRLSFASSSTGLLDLSLGLSPPTLLRYPAAAVRAASVVKCRRWGKPVVPSWHLQQGPSSPPRLRALPRSCRSSLCSTSTFCLRRPSPPPSREPNHYWPL